MNNNMSQPKIKKQGNKFVYFNDKGDSMGSINITTGKFVGATVCSLELYNHLEEYKKTPKYIEIEKQRLGKSIEESQEKFHRDLSKLEDLEK